VAVARVPASSGVLFPPPFGELEGDEARSWNSLHLEPSLLLFLYAFLLFLRVEMRFLDIATDDF
jgi:hypothetical protein